VFFFFFFLFLFFFFFVENTNIIQLLSQRLRIEYSVLLLFNYVFNTFFCKTLTNKTTIIETIGKRVVRHTVLLVHDPEEICDVGDQVGVRQSKPYSKRKRHIIDSIIKKDPGAAYLAANPEYHVTRLGLKQTRKETLASEASYRAEAADELNRVQLAANRASLKQQQEEAEQMRLQVLALREAKAGAPLLDTEPVDDNDELQQPSSSSPPPAAAAAPLELTPDDADADAADAAAAPHDDNDDKPDQDKR
jgi:ribosomal protein S17